MDIILSTLTINELLFLISGNENAELNLNVVSISSMA